MRLEVPQFRLMPGECRANFIEANRDVDEWLARRPGFKER